MTTDKQRHGQANFMHRLLRVTRGSNPV